MKRLTLIGLYLGAIVTANLIVTHYGPKWSIVTAFVLIGLDLTARDGLHDIWGEASGWRIRMAALIASGSILSYAINQDAGRIALASFAAFAAAGTVDTIAYYLLRGKKRFDRITGSNILSAAVDSVVFPALAFGLPLMYDITVGQFAAKVGGGVIFAYLLVRLWPEDSE